MPAIDRLLRQAASSTPSLARELHWSTVYAGELAQLEIVTAGGRISLAVLFEGPAVTVRTLANRLLPHWLPMMRSFVDMWSTQQQARVRERTMTAAVNACEAAIIMIDGRGRTTFANESAARIIARNDGLRRNGAALSGHRLADTLRLQAAIEHAIDDRGSSRDETIVVALSRAAGRSLLVSVVAAEPQPTDDRENAATLYLFDPDQDVVQSAQPACKLYGLSPVETKLTCLLANGRSLTDAAKQMRIRDQTARSYLKQIFSKTSTNRQAELVQLMLKSLVRTVRRSATT